MSPIIWALGGALVMHLVHRQSQTPSTAKPSSTKTAALTPARAAVHGELMANCNEPNKLMKAAALFGSEGLTHHAQMLFHKARLLHDMIHAAKDIVERCRAGDQHAMAMAKGIGEQARSGNKRAQLSAFLIEEYTKKNPQKDAETLENAA